MIGRFLVLVLATTTATACISTRGGKSYLDVGETIDFAKAIASHGDTGIAHEIIGVSPDDLLEADSAGLLFQKHPWVITGVVLRDRARTTIRFEKGDPTRLTASGRDEFPYSPLQPPLAVSDTLVGTDTYGTAWRIVVADLREVLVSSVHPCTKSFWQRNRCREP